MTVCLGYCMFTWDQTGKFMYLFFEQFRQGTYPLPVNPDFGFPKFPAGGFARVEDLPDPKNSGFIPWYVQSAVNSSVYAYERQNTRRNLYRIPLQ